MSFPKIKYYVEKSWLLLRFRIKFRPTHCEGCFITSHSEQLDSWPRVCFVLHDTQLTHLGDQLFFEPAARRLRDFCNVEISVNPSSEDYFKKAGYKTRAGVPLAECMLISTPEVLMRHLGDKHHGLALVTRLNSRKIPLSNHITQSIFDVIVKQTILESDVYPLSQPLNVEIEEHLIPRDFGNYLVFNEELDSGFFRKSKKKVDWLYRIAEKMQKQGVKIIKAGKSPKYGEGKKSFIFDMDVSQKTKPIDVWGLIGNHHCLGVISFDNFFFHVSCAYNKKCFVMPRGRYTKNTHRYVLNATIPANSAFKGQLFLPIWEKDFYERLDVCVDFVK